MRKVPIRLFVGTAVASTGSAESGLVDLRRFERAVTFTFQATSVAGTADLKLEVKYSDDGTTFGAYTDHAAIIASSVAAFGATPEGVQFVDVELVGAPFAMFQLTGVNSNPADTLATVTLEGEEL